MLTNQNIKIIKYSALEEYILCLYTKVLCIYLVCKVCEFVVAVVVDKRGGVSAGEAIR